MSRIRTPMTLIRTRNVRAFDAEGATAGVRVNLSEWAVRGL